MKQYRPAREHYEDEAMIGVETGAAFRAGIYACIGLIAVVYALWVTACQ